MYQIIYTSREREPLSLQELKNILLRSRVHNGPAGVTGLLIYHRGTFLQLIEGEEEPIKETYARIVADPRHHEITCLLNAAVARQRMFGDWSMGYINGADAARLRKVSIEFDSLSDLTRLDKDAAMQVLMALSHDSFLLSD